MFSLLPFLLQISTMISFCLCNQENTRDFGLLGGRLGYFGLVIYVLADAVAVCSKFKWEQRERTKKGKRSPFGLKVITINMHVVPLSPNLITEMNSMNRILWYVGPNASREYVWKDSICQTIVCVPCSRVLCGKYLKCKHEWIISSHGIIALHLSSSKENEWLSVFIMILQWKMVVLVD